MSASYLLRRAGVFLLIAWLAATLNFFLPRLTGQDPVRVKLLQQAQLGGYVQAGIDEMVKEYDRRFGLDRPLWAQYLTFLRGAATLDFNYSIANYPRTVNAMIAEALPWTVALLGTTTVVSFALGTFLGALLGLASSAPLDAVAHAAALGAPRDSLLPARAHPDLPLRVPVPDASRCSAATALAPSRP